MGQPIQGRGRVKDQTRLAALIADQGGLGALQWIVTQSPAYLKAGGYLIVEHGYDQGDSVLDFFHKMGYSDIRGHTDLAGKPRFVTGKK